MLNDMFYIILQMNCIATLSASLVLAVKYLLQRAGLPRNILFLLWVVVAFRLICPVSFASDFSIFNAAELFDFSGNSGAETQNKLDAVYYAASAGETDVAHQVSEETSKAGTAGNRIHAFPAIWLTGAAVMLLYAFVSCTSLKRRIRFALKYKDNVYFAENIPPSFVLGIFRPKIYIPAHLSDTDVSCIIAHEQMHMRRGDQITKILAYCLLSVHWFNPFNWLLFKLFSDDMELACDEAVISQIGISNKKRYLRALLQSADRNRGSIFLYHVCFSLHITKRRIKNVLRLKKHSSVFTVVAVVCILLTTIICGTDAVAKREQPPAYTAQQHISSAAPEQDFDKGYSATQEPASAMPTESLAVQPNAPQQTDTAQTAAYQSSGIEAEENRVMTDITADFVDVVPAQDKMPKQDETELPATADSQFMGIDFEALSLGDKAGIKEIQDRLNQSGRTQATSSYANVDRHYILNDSGAEGSGAYTHSVTCGKNNSISMYFDLDTNVLVDVTFQNTQRQEGSETFSILADSRHAYTFSGFAVDTVYNIEIQERTGSDWEIAGSYIVY